MPRVTLVHSVKPRPHHRSFSGMGWNCGRYIAMTRGACESCTSRETGGCSLIWKLFRLKTRRGADVSDPVSLTPVVLPAHKNLDELRFNSLPLVTLVDHGGRET